ncbi:PREDICTED: receptor-like serine/threonine-protein kinase ALE2 isoform X2 [Tarenaya hassleriana]|uniref:receptor-like serine/threonine-protein kinase ALE2 isoform X2 n=1 Tax=Tarenaya hassleriana TaxID=28532 RepID=UPI00053C40AE|nr:PREDICTED: receptor-like serine/threonine-protein kinase ALE2 isoform X2 [Tarenaya hassleriana]
MEMLILLLRICLLSSVLVLGTSSGSGSFPPVPSPTSPLPETAKGFAPPVPSHPAESPRSGNSPFPEPTQPSLPPPLAAAPPPSEGTVSLPPSPNASGKKTPAHEPVVSVPGSPAPAAIPVKDLPSSPPTVQPAPVSDRNPPNDHKPPIEEEPPAPVVASEPKISVGTPPAVHPLIPGLTPSSSPDVDHAPPPRINGPPPSGNRDDNSRSPVAEPPYEISKPYPAIPHKGSSPSISPSAPKSGKHSRHNASPVSSPLPSFHWHRQDRKKITSPSPTPPYLISPKHSKHHKGYAPSPFIPGSMVSPPRSPVSSSMHRASPAPAPSPGQVFPFRPESKPPKVPLGPPLQAFLPPPPNTDCLSTICVEPYTNTPPGSPCGCVSPMQVRLQLGVALYTFFPLVSEFTGEVATGVFMKQSQVRIMGANAASEQPEKSIVLVDLVPLGEKFDNMTALLTYQRFYSKKVYIDPSLFGDYDVIYVSYPGLPASPPFPPSGMTIIDDGPFSGNGGNGRINKPLGVDVPKKLHSKGLNGGTIAVIVLSASAFVGLCFAVIWVLLSKRRDRPSERVPLARASLPSLSKPSGSARSLTGSRLSSASLSFESSIAPFALSAKTFTASEVAKATNNFDESRVLGEGGFGRVYSGDLEDRTKVAVKVLKRDDQQGSREFLAEVEMLSRLHHRNLVNLIGICTEERNRCLVYELIPNGSVESHLHGVDKESSPLDWEARLKIALGAARGLSYLHEDSSPRVIHRDFKASNILLEHDFTPKVSDFGLARTALDEENRHISTRVMGTFGYVAPEYAMTGHLLVKSDVYSYGVVLLELLTGRKPVDMSQPPGQENLVAWTRHLLTSREGLEAIIDPSLGPDIPFDSVAKVAAIASMCVQPEVSHRPFMGEVVQALKLVCNECNEAKELNSVTTISQDDLSVRTRVESSGSGRLGPYPLLPNYDSEPDTERGVCVSEMLSGSGTTSTGSFRRHSSSGPLTTGRGKKFWQRVRRLSVGSLSEHGTSLMLRPGSL